MNSDLVQPAAVAVGSDANDVLWGTTGRDTLTGGLGDDTLNGGAGIDTAVFAGKSSDYRFGWRDGYLVVSDLNPTTRDEGTDLLWQVDALRFADREISLSQGGVLRVAADGDLNPAALDLVPSADGGYTIVWTVREELYAASGVHAQRFDAAGAAVGPEIQVNTTSVDQVHSPLATGLGADGILCVWNTMANPWSAYAQEFDPFLDATGDELDVTQPGVGNAVIEDAIGLPDGGYLLVWVPYPINGAFGSSINGQLFDANGARVGSGFAISTGTTPNTDWAQGTLLEDGSVVVAWEAIEGSLRSIRAQRVNADGTLAGEELVVSGSASNARIPAVAAVPGGGFVIAWQAFGAVTGLDIGARAYGADGNALSEPFVANKTLAGSQAWVAVAAQDDGTILVGWVHSDSDIHQILARRFSADGKALGSEQTLASTDSGAFQGLKAVALDDGGYLLSWGSIAENYLTDAFAVRLDALGQVLLPRVSGTAGNDVLDLRGDGDLEAAGRAGNDTYRLHVGDRVVEFGGGGSDTIVADFTAQLPDQVENLVLDGTAPIDGTGNGLANTLRGNGANNFLRGLRGNDTLEGAGGADRLIGGPGNDVLTGGAGADRFVFSSPLDAGTNIDLLMSFSTGIDKICLDASIFDALEAGMNVSAAMLRRGLDATESTTAEHRLIYDSASGALYYDPDGIGGVAATQFAQIGLDQHASLASRDFVIVA